MAIALDSTSSGVATTGTTVTVAHTCAANSILVVVAGGVDAINISGVTYNGDAMTNAVNLNSQMRNSIWYLTTPDAGTYNIVATKTDGYKTDVAGISFTGASGISATGTANGFGQQADLTVTTAEAGNGYVVSMLAWNDQDAVHYDTSGTEWYLRQSAGNFAFSAVYVAYAAGANPSFTWTDPGNNRGWACCGIEVVEAATTTFKPIMASF